MVLAGSAGAITDASSNKWTITGTGQVAVNGVADPTTRNVTELAYVNNVVWQENSSALWWSKTDPAASWTPGAGTATSPLPAPVTIAASATSATVSQSEISVVATAGSHKLFISGTGDIASLSGGTNTITDTGGGNTYVLPAAGKGIDKFTSNISHERRHAGPARRVGGDQLDGIVGDVGKLPDSCRLGGRAPSCRWCRHQAAHGR